MRALHHRCVRISDFCQPLFDVLAACRENLRHWQTLGIRIGTLTVGVVFCSTTSVGAISSNQANVLNQGIFYFDTEISCNDLTSSSNTSLSGNDNGQKIFNYFVSKGYTKDQAAGLVGNTQAESGNIPTRLQDGAIAGVKTISYAQIPANITTNQQVGWGIVQWTPPSKIGAYAQTTHENPDDLATQVEFLWKQLDGTAPNNNEKPAGDAVKKTTNYSDAALAFMNDYERPQYPQQDGPIRVQLAKEALAAYGPQSGGPISPSSCSNTGGTTAGVCTTPAPTGGYDAVKQALMTQFKVNLTGQADATWAVETYNTACALSKAPTYYSKLIAQGPITVTLHAGSCGSGHASASTGVDLYGFCDKNYNRFILTHELGHIFAFRNPTIYQSYLNTVWGKNPLLPTWNCEIHSFGPSGNPLPSGPFSGDQAAECWADMIGEYLMWFNLRGTVSGAPAGTPDFKQYPTQYAGYYNFAKNTLFGGVVYNSF